ncbi:MAG: nucleotidyltransferase family protein [Planctomycetes bacterium]|nr:nucleotidyltransferase family protein [Planctomycetota bacterium]
MKSGVVRIDVCRESLLALCRRHHIRKLSLFGSVLRDDFGPGSDVDVLVEFQPGHTPGWEIVDIQDELSKLFGERRVDMVNPRYLNRRLKDRILDSTLVQYEASDET